MISRLKYRVAWWIAFKLPVRVALYAFVRVHAITGEGPSYNGEYAKAYEQFKVAHKIKE